MYIIKRQIQLYNVFVIKWSKCKRVGFNVEVKNYVAFEMFTLVLLS